MSKLLDYDLEVSEFELELRYFVNFQTKTQGERYEPFCPSAVG